MLKCRHTTRRVHKFTLCVCVCARARMCACMYVCVCVCSVCVVSHRIMGIISVGSHIEVHRSEKSNQTNGITNVYDAADIYICVPASTQLFLFKCANSVCLSVCLSNL